MEQECTVGDKGVIADVFCKADHSWYQLYKHIFCNFRPSCSCSCCATGHTLHISNLDFWCKYHFWVTSIFYTKIFFIFHHYVLCRYASACVRPRGLSGDRLVAAPCSVRAPRPAPACISWPLPLQWGTSVISLHDGDCLTHAAAWRGDATWCNTVMQ